MNNELEKAAREFHYKRCVGKVEYTDESVIKLMADFAAAAVKRERERVVERLLYLADGKDVGFDISTALSYFAAELKEGE